MAGLKYFTALTFESSNFMFSPLFFLFLLLCFHPIFSVLVTAYFSLSLVLPHTCGSMFYLLALPSSHLIHVLFLDSRF